MTVFKIKVGHTTIATAKDAKSALALRRRFKHAWIEAPKSAMPRYRNNGNEGHRAYSDAVSAVLAPQPA